MGFNKRYISENNLRTIYKKDGAEGVIRAFFADAIILDDSFSSEVNHLMENFSSHRNRDLLVEELDKKFKVC